MDHIWDSRTLTGRPSSWKEITSRKNPDNIMEMTRSKLGMSVPQLEDNEIRRSRSTMLADRRTHSDAFMSRLAKIEAKERVAAKIRKRHCIPVAALSKMLLKVGWVCGVEWISVYQDELECFRRSITLLRIMTSRRFERLSIITSTLGHAAR